MIDWLTLILPNNLLSEKARDVLRLQGHRIITTDPKTGDIKSETSKFFKAIDPDQAHSDLYGVSVQYGSNLIICGSPARTHSTHNIFGSSDPIECFKQMVEFVERAYSITLPKNPTKWKCTRLDYNQMYDMGGQVGVAQSLSTLRHAETRGNNVTMKGDSVYWNASSIWIMLKAYNKYKDVLRTMRKGESHVTEQQLKAIEGLLRFEMKLGRSWFAKTKERSGINWHEIRKSDLKALFEEQMKVLVGEDMNIQSHDGLRDKFKHAAIQCGLGEGTGLSAYRTFNMIKLEGIENVKREMAQNTFYVHQRVMRAVGMSKADITTGRILEFRRKTLVIEQPVTGWDGLRLVS